MAALPWMPTGVGGWLPPIGLSGGLHTRLLGFVKTALLRQLVPPNSLVCDLFCGRGLDTETWAEAMIGRYIGVDLSASALEEAQEQWEQHDRPFPAEFCELDPCMVDLETALQNQGLPADIVSCLAHLQDSFTSEEMVKRLLKNVEAVLKPGGYFFGIAPDSSTIWYKYQKAVQEAMKAGSLRVNGTLPAVRTENYKITFDDDRFHEFGSKYHMRFTDDGLPAQPQLLVHFPSLIRLAKEVGLECVEIQNLMEFYDDYSDPFADVLRHCCGSLVDFKGVPVLDAKGRLSGQAMDVLSLYTTFIFKKGDPEESESFELPFKGSSSAAQYLTNLPSQTSEIISSNMDVDLGRNEQEAMKVEEPAPLIVDSTSPKNNLHCEQMQQDLHPQDIENHDADHREEELPSTALQDTGGHDREEEVSQVMHEANSDETINKTTSISNDDSEGQVQGLTEQDLTKRHGREPGSSSHHVDTSMGEGHPAADQSLEHPAQEIEPNSGPNEASNSDARIEYSLGREKMHPKLSKLSKLSTTRVRRASTGSIESGPSTSLELGQVSLRETEHVDKIRPAGRGSNISSEGRNKSLGESSARELQGPHLANHTPHSSLRGASERIGESSRGAEQAGPSSVADRSPKHYTRRGQEKSSSKNDNQQELSTQGDHNSQNPPIRSFENRNESSRNEKPQDKDTADHSKSRPSRLQENRNDSNRDEGPLDEDTADIHLKRTQQKSVGNLDQRNRHTNNNNKKESSSSQDPTSRRFERRTQDNVDDRGGVSKQQNESLAKKGNVHERGKVSKQQRESPAKKGNVDERGKISKQQHETPAKKGNVDERGKILKQQHESPAKKGNVDERGKISTQQHESPAKKGNVDERGKILKQQRASLAKKDNVDERGKISKQQHESLAKKDNVDDRGKASKQQRESPATNNNSSKQDARRPSDGLSERHNRSEEFYDKRGHQSGRPRWDGSSGSQQEGHGVFQCSQDGMASRGVPKKFAATSSAKSNAGTSHKTYVMTSRVTPKKFAAVSAAKSNARTAHGEDVVMTPRTS